MKGPSTQSWGVKDFWRRSGSNGYADRAADGGHEGLGWDLEGRACREGVELTADGGLLTGPMR